MLITLPRCTAICQSVAENWLTGVAPLGVVSHRFIFFILTCPYVLLSYEAPDLK